MDWKEFLKPSKEIVILFVALVPIQLLIFFFFSAFFGDFLSSNFGLAAASELYYGLYAILSPFMLIMFALSLLPYWLPLRELFGIAVFFLCWSLTLGIFYLLASFVVNRLGLRGIKGVLSLLILSTAVLIIYDSVGLFASLGFERDQGCFVSGYLTGSQCPLNVTGFSGIRIGASICDMKSKTPAYVKNSGEYPIVLKSVKLITAGCSRDFDTPLKPGEGKEVILGCRGIPDTLEVTYLQTVDGKTTTVVETGMIAAYPASYLRDKCVIS